MENNYENLVPDADIAQENTATDEVALAEAETLLETFEEAVEVNPEDLPIIEIDGAADSTNKKKKAKKPKVKKEKAAKEPKPKKEKKPKEPKVKKENKSVTSVDSLTSILGYGVQADRDLKKWLKNRLRCN